MAVTEQTATRRRNPADRLLFDTPAPLLAIAAVLAATIKFGYGHGGNLASVTQIAANPFKQLLDGEPWLYQSPVGPMLAWAVGMNDMADVALVHYVCTLVVVVGCTYLVGRWQSELAARLFVFAYFCSPNAWASVAWLGIFDILTLGGLTVAFFAPSAAVGCAVGVFLGVQHFEQAAVALLAIAMFRIKLRHERPTIVVWTFVGLVVGRIILAVYLSAAHIEQAGRLRFLLDNAGTMIEGWRGDEATLIWAVYNVLWVPIIWQLRRRNRDEVSTVVLSQLLVTFPVLLTYDLSRVYRIVSWPIVLLFVVWIAEDRDQRTVRRAVPWLLLAAWFVPRTELWFNGIRLN